MSYDTIKSIAALIVILIAGAIFLVRAYQLLWRNLRRGRASERYGRWGERIWGLVKYVAAQGRLFRVLIPGTAHFFIFWGFALLSFTILQAILEGLLAFINPHFVIPLIGEFGPLALVQDLIVVAVVVAMIYALYMRLVVRPERYKGSHTSQGVMVLLFILTIMISLLVMNGIRINQAVDELAAWRPVSRLVGSLFAALAPAAQKVIEEVAYWIHLAIVLIFLTELPGGKHFHVVTSVPAVLLRNLKPPGRLPPLPEGDGDAGVQAVEQFTWRTMLDFYTCTECGRCQDVCPAYESGSVLSPKVLMMGLRDNLIERGDVRHLPEDHARAKAVLKKELTGDIFSDEFIWACMTCYACDQECPLFLEHVTPLVEMRRHLVMEGRMDEILQDALANFGRYGNSFGQSERARAKWTRGLEPAVKDARKEPVEYLWFVGDYASYNPNLRGITQKTAQVLGQAGIDFGILYDGERNAGNDVRRIGEEGLFEMLMEENTAAMGRAKFSAIITTDPHSYNTLKHEYANNGKDWPVFHISEILDEAIASGRLPIKRRLNYTVTYHDPCYLGRYNDIYAAPRRVIEALGCKLMEMPHNRDRALCCGAGGGRIWMEEKADQQRPSEIRVREALGLGGVHSMVVACPKDYVMFSDAAKTVGGDRELVVTDLIELVAEATLEQLPERERDLADQGEAATERDEMEADE